MQKKMNIRTLHMALKTNTASDKPNFTIMIQNEEENNCKQKDP